MNIERKHAAVFLRHVFVFIEEMSFEQLEFFEPFEYEIMLINFLITFSFCLTVFDIWEWSSISLVITKEK